MAAVKVPRMIRRPRRDQAPRSQRCADPQVLERDLPEREPALQLGLDRQLVLELRLELELALVIALLLARRGDERVVLAPLEVVDEEDGLAARVRVLEGED